MTIAAKRLIQGTPLPGSQTTFYTSPALTTTVIKAANVLNDTGSPATLYINLVPSGGSPVDDNAVIKAMVIAPGQTYQCPELINQVLEPGDFISAESGTASALDLTVSGVQIF